jgi:mannitol-specific phosphotransferase system IIBC component
MTWTALKALFGRLMSNLAVGVAVVASVIISALYVSTQRAKRKLADYREESARKNAEVKAAQEAVQAPDDDEMEGRLDDGSY